MNALLGFVFIAACLGCFLSAGTHITWWWTKPYVYPWERDNGE